MSLAPVGAFCRNADDPRSHRSTWSQEENGLSMDQGCAGWTLGRDSTRMWCSRFMARPQEDQISDGDLQQRSQPDLHSSKKFAPKFRSQLCLKHSCCACCPHRFPFDSPARPMLPWRQWGNRTSKLSEKARNKFRPMHSTKRNEAPWWTQGSDIEETRHQSRCRPQVREREQEKREARKKSLREAIDG